MRNLCHSELKNIIRNSIEISSHLNQLNTLYLNNHIFNKNTNAFKQLNKKITYHYQRP